MNGHVILRPSSLPPQFTNPPADPDTDIFACHPNSMAVFFQLYFAYRIQTYGLAVIQHRLAEILAGINQGAVLRERKNRGSQGRRSALPPNLFITSAV